MTAIDLPQIHSTRAFKLSPQETLFFQCLIEALGEHGIEPPRQLQLHSSISRVVDYDHVKALMAKRMLSEDDKTPAGIDKHRNRVNTALRRNREALMNFKVVDTANPYIWYTGKPVSCAQSVEASTSPIDQLMFERARAIEALADADAIAC